MIVHEIEKLLHPVLTDMGYELWGCEYMTGRHPLLRVYIDKPEGITVDDCARVSRHVSSMLDVEDPIKSHYYLEVSSPGLPRPLFREWHYERYIGSEISLKLYQPVQEKRKWQGIIKEVTGESVTIQYPEGQITLPLASIVKATVED